METRATVIIPTFGNAKFARWAIKSVQNQTVEEIEICIICDGSPENMVSFFKNMEKEDRRIKVFAYPKSPRTGEPYRDIVIRQTTGKIICYCGHDDLWLPEHVAVMEKTLKKSYFAHSLPAIVNLPENIKDENTLLGDIHWNNINPEIMQKMQGGFGLAFGAHTRTSYFKLKEGWITTPQKDIGTDQYMWCKFLSAFEKHWKATNKLTVLNFPHFPRKHWSEEQRNEELKQYYEKIQTPVFLRQLEQNVLYLSRVEWWGGFSALERDKEYNWRWCSEEGTLVINNATGRDMKFVMSAHFQTGYPELSNLKIESTMFNENLKISSNKSSFNKNFVLPPGRHNIKFSCDAPRLVAPNDPRNLVFCTFDFQLNEVK